MSDEPVGKLVFPVEHANHLAFLNDKYAGGRNRGRSRHADGLARKAAFPKEVTRPQNRHNGFFAGFIDHSKLHTAFLNVHDILCRIALREDGFFSSKLANLSPEASRIEKQFHIERGAS
jgi:hypothetical protein